MLVDQAQAIELPLGQLCNPPPYSVVRGLRPIIYGLRQAEFILQSTVHGARHGSPPQHESFICLGHLAALRQISGDSSHFDATVAEAPHGSRLAYKPMRRNGGEGWIRTSVRLRGQIYSLLPLTTRPPLHEVM